MEFPMRNDYMMRSRADWFIYYVQIAEISVS